MIYLLNANAVITVLNDSYSRVGQRVRQQAPEDVCISAIVTHELYFGAFKSQRRERNLARVDLLNFQVVDFDQEDARAAGEIRALLAASGQPIGPYDLLIAGQARARDLILVTHTVGEFQRVPGLRFEDWEV